MNKLLARAEAENATLKDEVARLRALLAEWQEWEAATIDDDSKSIADALSDVNYEWMIRLQHARNEALKR